MGQEGERIPFGATHIIVHESVTVIRAEAFEEKINIVEVICHGNVEKIEEWAFFDCWSLRRVIMPGVKIVEELAFGACCALTDVDCGKLEIVGENAFYDCKSLANVECDLLEIIGENAFVGCRSLRSINLPSARIVEESAFCYCIALTDVKFGCMLDRIEEDAFQICTSLERITIPLKDGIIAADDTFQGCENLKNVDPVEEEFLRETIAALQLEEWRNVTNEEVGSINQILPTADAGHYDFPSGEDVEGEKAQAIRRWIRSVLRKIMHYKAQHCRLLGEDVAPTLQRILPQDIVMNSILPFLELPSHAFVDWNLHEDEEDDSESDDEEMEEEE